MDSLRFALAAAGLLVVFAASIVARAPIRLPRRARGAHESESARIIHRGLASHIAVTIGVAAGVVASPALGALGLILFALGLLLFRFLGFIAASRSHRLVHMARPLLAPIDGAAHIADWILSPVLRRAGGSQMEQTTRSVAHQHVLDLTRRTVEQVMIPRSAVVWLRSSAGREEIVDAIRRRPHSRYPIFEGDAEQLAGMLELFDLIGTVPADATAGRLAQQAILVPETMGCDALLEKMRIERFDTAVVIDEFGGVAGLVTLEDLLEVIVGELTGEHETVPVRVRRMEDGSSLVDGALRLDEFEDIFGVPLPEGDYETLAGLFLSRTARIPGQGEKLDFGSVRMEVAEADERRIRTLRVVVPGEESGAA